MGIAGKFKVPVVTLDWFIRNSVGLVGRAVDHVDIAKVDVEGYELMVLRGAMNTPGRGLIDRFVIEVHTDQVSTRDVINCLGQFGYVAIGLRRFGHVKDILYVRLKR